MSIIVLVVWLRLYINIRPSFMGLALVIVFSISMFDSFSVYLSETVITEKGIVDGNYF